MRDVIRVTPIGVAVGMVFRERWGVTITPGFANEVGAAVLGGPPSKVAVKAKTLDGDREIPVVTTIAEVRTALTTPFER